MGDTPAVGDGMVERHPTCLALDGAPTTYPECIVFEQNDDGLIFGVSVFLKQPAGQQRRT